jgi:hypothetical protein
VAVIALATAGVVALAGGGDAFWLCVPAVLVACASSQTRLGAALSAAVVIASAAVPTVGWMGSLPSPLLALVVPAASVTVLVAVRERLLHEREARRDARWRPAPGSALCGVRAARRRRAQAAAR